MVTSVSRRTMTLMSNKFHSANPVSGALGPVRWEEDSGGANVPSCRTVWAPLGIQNNPEGRGLRRFNLVGLLRTLHYTHRKSQSISISNRLIILRVTKNMTRCSLLIAIWSKA